MAFDNLRPKWASVAARMQQVACVENANAVINISVLIDRDGNPVFWFEPTVSKLEPAAKFTDALAEMIRSKGQL